MPTKASTSQEQWMATAPQWMATAPPEAERLTICNLMTLPSSSTVLIFCRQVLTVQACYQDKSRKVPALRSPSGSFKNGQHDGWPKPESLQSPHQSWRCSFLYKCHPAKQGASGKLDCQPRRDKPAGTRTQPGHCQKESICRSIMPFVCSQSGRPGLFELSG